MSSRVRKLRDGTELAVHTNDGLRKLCGCPRGKWPKCTKHPWHFSYQWKGKSYRFSLNRHLGKVELSKSEAEREAERLRIDIRAGRFSLMPTATTPSTSIPERTFEALGTLYRENATPRKARDVEAWRNDVKGKLNRICAFPLNDQSFGQKPASAVTESDLEAFLSHLRADGKAASTRNNYLQLFRGLFRWAVRKGHLGKNPIGSDSDLRRERPARRSRRLIPSGGPKKPGEEERLLGATNNSRLQRLIIAALETACRRGELLKLQWKDVSMERRELTIQGKNAKDGETRILPISDRLWAVLEMARTGADGESRQPDDFVFGEVDGSQIKNVKKAWGNACRKAKIEDLRFHDLRHEAASRMLEAGFPIHHVQQMLGHGNVQTTDTYLNATKVGLKESMRQLDDLRSRCKPVANDPAEETQVICNEQPQHAPKAQVN